MGFGLKIAKADPKVIDERVQEAATILDLEQDLDRQARQPVGWPTSRTTRPRR